ncbi:hypothetical protein EM595_p0139 (plasmid) [Duffyella gerundensis]|uniref:Uncharacterized protein n=1 Tax=Duffyella gerundensis TaxID=1619313 RepID=A0A0U5L7F1_9GAMM|nr:hypothetical protein EM595_p0139 [Duffyella gerundensis]
MWQRIHYLIRPYLINKQCIQDITFWAGLFIDDYFC